MAASNTDVCNGALVKLGVDTLVSLADNTKQGRLCTLRYDYLRKQLLRAHTWNFAKKRATLSATAGLTAGVPPLDYFTYTYPLPSDLLKLLDNNLDENDEWANEINNILCFSSSLTILYIFNQTDTTQFDDLFTETLEWKIAADMAYSLVQSVTLAKACFDAYTESLKLARSTNAQERGSMQQVVADDWTQARLGTGTFGFGSDPSKL